MATLYDTNKCLSMVLKEKTNICSQLATVHAYVPSNEIFRGFAFKYGKFLLPPRSLMTLSIPNVPACKQFQRIFISIFNKYFMLCNTPKQQIPAPYKNLNTLAI